MNKYNPFYPPNSVDNLEKGNTPVVFTKMDKILSGIMSFFVGIVFSVICLLGCIATLHTLSPIEDEALGSTTMSVLLIIHILLGLIIFPIGLYKNIMKKKL